MSNKRLREEVITLASAIEETGTEYDFILIVLDPKEDLLNMTSSVRYDHVCAALKSCVDELERQMRSNGRGIVALN